MKKILSLLLGILMSLGVSFGCGGTKEIDPAIKNAPWYKDGELKILMLGNSFSIDTAYYLWKVAHSAGVEKVTIGNLAIPSCSLDTHYEKTSTNAEAYEYHLTNDKRKGEYKMKKDYVAKDAVQSENWDFISLQQVSGQSGWGASYLALPDLIAWVSGLCPDAKLVWNMTWAYQADSTHHDFKKYGNEQMNMYNAIVETTQRLIATNPAIDVISPTGTAIQNARAILGDTATRDGFHLAYEEEMGAGTYNARYLASLCFFAQLTELSLDMVTYAPDNVNAETKAIFIDAAKKAILNPFSVS